MKPILNLKINVESTAFDFVYFNIQLAKNVFGTTKVHTTYNKKLPFTKKQFKELENEAKKIVKKCIKEKTSIFNHFNSKKDVQVIEGIIYDSSVFKKHEFKIHKEKEMNLLKLILESSYNPKSDIKNAYESLINDYNYIVYEDDSDNFELKCKVSEHITLDFGICKESEIKTKIKRIKEHVYSINKPLVIKYQTLSKNKRISSKHTPALQNLEI